MDLLNEFQQYKTTYVELSFTHHNAVAFSCYILLFCLLGRTDTCENGWFINNNEFEIRSCHEIMKEHNNKLVTYVITLRNIEITIIINTVTLKPANTNT